MKNHLLGTARFYFAQCVFMNSIHYKSYDRIEAIQKRNRRIVMAIALGTLLVIILQIVGYEFSNTSLLTVLSFCGLILTGAALAFELFNKEDLSELKFQHRNSAEDYKVLRDQFMCLIEKIMSSSVPKKKLRKSMKGLINSYGQIGKYSPTTTSNDYSNAQAALGLKTKKDEEFTWSDKEIDKFLPKELHL